MKYVGAIMNNFMHGQTVLWVMGFGVTCSLYGCDAASAEPVPSGVTMSAPDGVFSRIVTLKSSNPDISLTGVASAFGPVADVAGLGSGTVSYRVIGDDDHGIECAPYHLWVETSTGGHITPSGNICDTWSLTLDGNAPSYAAGYAPAAPAEMVWSRYTARPDENAGVEPFYPREGLTFAIPETDAIAISMTCPSGSGQITTNFFFTASPEDPALPAPDIYLKPVTDAGAQGGTQGGAFDFFKIASRLNPINIEGMTDYLPELFMFTHHPFWADFQKSHALEVTIGDAQSHTFPIGDGRSAITDFLSRCKQDTP